MNEIIINEMIDFSEWALLKVLACGLILLVCFRFLRRWLHALAGLRRSFAPVHRVLPAIEASLWLIYVMWAVGAVFTEGWYSNAALLMILAVGLALVSWFAARDWIAGIILRVQDAYEIGQKVRIGDVEGTIGRVGYLALEIELTGGERTKIPYSRISGQVRSQIRTGVMSNDHRFEIEIDDGISLGEAKRTLRKAILNSPWAAFDREPQISLLAETPTYRFAVVVHTTGVGTGQAMEHHLRELLAERLDS